MSFRIGTTLLAVGLAGATAANAGTLLVANKTDGTVDLVDASTGTSRATLPTGAGPHEAAVSANGRYAVVANYGQRDAPGSTLTVLDVTQASVLRTIDLGEHERPHGLFWIGKGEVVVTTEGSRHLLVVDVLRGEILQAVETGQEVSHMVAVTPDGKRAFVANIGSGSVTVIDLVAGKKLKDVATGEGAEGIAMTPDGKQVWITNRAADTISIVDADTLEIAATLPCKGFPIRVALTPDGRRALVSCARSGEVALFDVAGRREVLRKKLDLSTVPDATSRLFGDRFGNSPVPVGLVVAPDGRSAWVAATQSDVVVVLDVETLEVRDLIQVGREPDGMAYSSSETSSPKPRG